MESGEQRLGSKETDFRASGLSNLRNKDIRGLWELGEQSWSSEHPNTWNLRDPRKQTQILGVLRSQLDRHPGF